ncbi:MAG: hypothetical protein HYV95_12540 [Opitutae bacterium]|nr:hypothetical protein [Opitutae bacterium]
MANRTPAQNESLILGVIFAGMLLAHVWLATRNWTVGFMPGHEFRQTQTAFIAHFIDRNDDFSLLYEAPIVGKPWVSILLEVPIYEWSVVGLSRATGWPHVVAARTVSLACFYLVLPAVWLLLGRFRVLRPRRLLPLVLILACPIHIFYSRSFLMESMELMCCAWFLVGYVWMMDRRRWFWFLLATVAGTGAALIKSATLAVWLIPAAAYAAGMLWRGLRTRAGWGAFAQTVFWGLAGVVVPLGALQLWIGLTDPLKAAHASAWIFTSANLSLGNWGLNDFAAKFSPSLWNVLVQRWSEALMPSWLIGVTLVAGFAAFPAQRARVAGVVAVFFLAQLLFPYAYAYQEYYFYACAVFLFCGLGFILHGLLDSRLPRWLCWLLIAVLPAAELHTYWRVYRPGQIAVSQGGFSYTRALQAFTPRESVIVVCGADWAAIVPYYAQRRALLIRNGLVSDRVYLERAFSELDDEDVAGLVLIEGQRGNTLVRDLAAKAFALDERPTFSSPRADVYIASRYSQKIKDEIRNRGYFDDLKIAEPVTPARTVDGLVKLDRGPFKDSTTLISPVPIMARFNFGMNVFTYENRPVLNAHPDSEAWLRPASKASVIEWEFGMVSSAWEKDGGRTDGVEMVVTGLRPGRDRRVIYRRVLDPVAHPEDRGLQHATIPYQPLPGEFLLFSTSPRRSYSYDWSYWARINVK